MWLLIVFSLAIIYFTAYYLERRYRRPYIDRFQSKAVFVTGTDSGFGFKLAVDLAKLGVKVYAGCYTEEGAAGLRKATNDDVTTVKIDITDENSVRRAKEIVEEDLKQTGKDLWGVVNNAGLLLGFTFVLSTREDYRRLMEVNFFGTMTVTETFLPLIKKSAGRIVDVISLAGRVTGLAEPYTCSKHAMEAYSDGLRRWMKCYNVHVAIIEPGMMKSTQLWNQFTLEEQLDNAIVKLPQDLQEEYGTKFLDQVKREIVEFLGNPPYSRFNRTSMVTDAMEHALFAQHPKDRYVCGWDARIVYRLAPILPDYIIDLQVKQWFPHLRMYKG